MKKEFTEETRLKVYLVGNSYHYLDFIYNKIILVKKIEDADLVFFTGGEDVDPSLYGEKAHSYTSFNTTRDSVEIKAFNEAQKYKVPCYGTCRGSQFLCVMSGGKLVQHMSHAGKHLLMMQDGVMNIKCMTNSLHHQMQYPFNLDKADYEVLGWSEGISPFNWMSPDKDIGIMKKEAEVVFYNKTNSLGFQGHPEMLNASCLAVVTLNNYLLRLLNGTLGAQTATV